MKTRNKNPAKAELIKILLKASLEKKAPIWKSVAEELNKPRRVGREVNLVSLEKNADKDPVVVAGTVLGNGDIKKHVKVAAYRFSSGAREKIEKAGGRCMTIEELVSEHPTGKNVRMMA